MQEFTETASKPGTTIGGGRRIYPVDLLARNSGPAAVRGPGQPERSVEDGGRYVRIEGIAAYTALTVRHLHDLTRRREIPHIRVGKVVLYDKAAVDQWLNDCQSRPAELPDWRRPIGAAPLRRRAGRERTR